MEVVLHVHLWEVDDPLALLVGPDAVEAAFARSDVDADTGERLAVLVDDGAGPAPVTGRDSGARCDEAERSALSGRRRRGRLRRRGRGRSDRGGRRRGAAGDDQREYENEERLRHELLGFLLESAGGRVSCVTRPPDAIRAAYGAGNP